MARLPVLLVLGIVAIFAQQSLASQGDVVIEVTHRPEQCETKASNGDFIGVHYVGKLTDGTEFDNSYSRGEPIEFQLGAQQVIPGWEEGVQGMCVGEKRHLEIPPHLGYGEEGIGPIPGGATLLFDVELMRITDEPQAAPEEAYPGSYETYQNFGGEEMGDDETLGEINFGDMQMYGDEDDGPAEWS